MMKIYIDYDTTLINLIDPWVDWINEKYNVNITSNDINRWYFLGEVFDKKANDFWRSEEYNHYMDKEFLLPFKGAVDFFHALENKYGKSNVIIISATRKHHKEEKIKHAKHYFGIIDEQFIASEKEKYEYTKDGILIDDYPLHVMEHIHHNNQKGIVFNYEDRFGWCKLHNYRLDEKLTKFSQITKNDNFSIATSYEQVFKELNDGRME